MPLLREWRLGLIGVVVLALSASPSTSSIVQCPIHRVTGLYCPGCGSIRAVKSLVEFDLAGAWHQNALLLCSPLLLLLLPPLKSRQLQRPYLVGLAVITLLFAVVRNLPGSVLAPV